MTTSTDTPLEAVARDFSYGIAFPSRCARVFEALKMALDRLRETRCTYSGDEEAQEELELELAIGDAADLVALEAKARGLLES